MIRKVVLLLCVITYFPAPAHAWTIAAKIGSPSGSITGKSPNAATVTTGTGYLTVPAGDTAVTITPNPGYRISLVVLDTVAQPIDTSGGVLAVPREGKNSRTLTAYFTATTYSVTVNQAPGGKVWVRQISPTTGATSQTGIVSLRTGAVVRVTAAPDTGHTVTSIGVGGSRAWTGSSDASQVYDYTVLSTSPTVTAGFPVRRRPAPGSPSVRP